jgi:hypothetical protein
MDGFIDKQRIQQLQGIPRHSDALHRPQAANRWIRLMAWHGKWQSFMWLTMVNHA